LANGIYRIDSGAAVKMVDIAVLDRRERRHGR
jgi:hypothetical protein